MSTKEKVLSYTTPWGAIKRSARSISKAKGSIQETAQALGHSLGKQLPGQAGEAAYEEGDVRNITDSKLRFETMYEMHKWTPGELKTQVKVLRRTKMTAFVMSIIAAGGVVVVATMLPRWAALFMIPLAGISMIVGFAQGFKYALYEAQIDLRELISSREYVSRNDFWKRLFG